MTIIEKNLKEIDEYLYFITKEVNSINDENLDIKLKNVNSFIKQIDRKKTEIKNSATNDYYLAVCDKIHNEVKQITAKFDNIIEAKKENLKSISEELSKTVNKKKLINYQR
ncbi:MAG: hypothetical protein HYS24_08640 [Ignavibacteriales bacterium]|nr:hypothetical protein [Ignavibacteriales bacterium]MBK7980608.1 hypothetical protein [Ignavibacteriota bacterium]